MQFLKRDTNRSGVLYLSLEDTLLRLQNRLYELTEEPQENLHLAVEAPKIGQGLEAQLEQWSKEHANLKLIVIDTLQKIREVTDVNYSTDYKELSSLKAVADKLKLTILLVHHTRKCYDSDPFNMISGSTGLLGCADGSMVLIETKRGSRQAKLYCAGRDMENSELNLVFQNHRWTVQNNVPERKQDTFSFAVHDLMMAEQTFRGTATEFCELLSQRFSTVYYPNHVTRDLVQHTSELAQYGVLFRSSKSHGSRLITLQYLPAQDSNRGAFLYVDVMDSSQPSSPDEEFSAPLLTEQSLC